MPNALITGYLQIVRASMGAEEVVFWRIQPESEELVPEWWATAHGGEPEHFVEQTWRSLVTWTVQENRPQTVGTDPVMLVAAPIQSDGIAIGALSISSESGLRQTKEPLKSAITRF